ncbi:uncharacterized protein J4E79_002418 [Alternaria viburni]|uniref:uncharacterized protein n=1 Tax=Alternaria viburni TaxID=566460 RepID=UPI0020C22FB7|nr:uncharacterized protein J4E79_002418 [Alternaria viburni]KAI4666380.1 hypothetical protein J4E79_002418 [Alternaria viburni]
MSSHDSNGGVTQHNDDNKSSEYDTPVKGTPTRLKDLGIINDTQMREIRKVDGNIKTLVPDYRGNCKRIWIAYKKPLKQGIKPQWKAKINLQDEEEDRIEPNGENDRPVKGKGASLMEAVNDMDRELEKRMPKDIAKE